MPPPPTHLHAGASANLMCSGSDPTCQKPLYDNQFFAQLSAADYAFDYRSKKNQFVVNGVTVASMVRRVLPCTACREC